MKKYVSVLLCLFMLMGAVSAVYAESPPSFVIEPQYDSVINFRDGRVGVQKNGKWGSIDKTGKEIVKLQYDHFIQFINGYASVDKNSKLGFLDMSGAEVIPLQYDGEFGNSHFYDELARVQKEGKFGYIDKSGKEIIKFQYEKAADFYEGLAAVKKDGKWGFIDKTGREVVQIPQEYDQVGVLSKGIAVAAKNNKWGFIDKTGKEVIGLNYDYAQIFSEGLSAVRKDGKWGYIDRNGKEVVGFQYEDISFFVKGQKLSAVKKDGKWGFIDRTGKTHIHFQYEDAKYFSLNDDLAPVKLNGKWGFIDTSGNVIIQPKYEYADGFSEGMAGVQIGGKWGFIANPLGTKKPASREPNVVFDYKTLTGYTTIDEFIKNLENTLSSLNGEKPNDAGNAAITQNIEYAMQTAIQGSVSADKNRIVITGDQVKDVWNKVDSAQKKYDALLDKFGITLDKSIGRDLRINTENVNLDKPVTVQFDKSVLQNAGNADGIFISLDGKQHSVSISIEDLKPLISQTGAASVQIEKNAKPGSYTVTFLNPSNRSIDQIPYPLTFTIPSGSEFSTVFANYKGGSDNWGGQYDPQTGSIKFATKFSGEYSLLDNQVKISDSGNLPQERQKAINFMVSKGYFTLDDEAFKPDGLMDRNSFTMALVKMFFALDRGKETTFTDVQKDNEFYPYIASAQVGDIVQGFEDNTFRGSRKVLLEEVIALCSRTLVGKKGYHYPANPKDYLTFSDAGAISKWAEQDVALAVRAGLIHSDGLLKPQNEMTREQAADILYKLFMLLYDTPPAAIQADVANAKAADSTTDLSTPKASTSRTAPLLILFVGLLAAGAGYWMYTKKKQKV